MKSSTIPERLWAGALSGIPGYPTRSQAPNPKPSHLGFVFRAWLGNINCSQGLGKYMGSCQNYGPFLGTLNIRCRIIIGIQKGTIILTTTQILYDYQVLGPRRWGSTPRSTVLWLHPRKASILRAAELLVHIVDGM